MPRQKLKSKTVSTQIVALTFLISTINAKSFIKYKASNVKGLQLKTNPNFPTISTKEEG